MTRLIARLILAMLILPLSGALFVIGMGVCASTGTGGSPEAFQLLILWAVLYVFIAVYWICLWKGIVRWTAHRTRGTWLAGVCAIAIGVAVGVIVRFALQAPAFGGVLMGGGFPPIVWVLATVLLWRETTEERIARITAAGTDAVLCPNCGYNLTGLHEARCPECGSSFTLDQLLNAHHDQDKSVLVDPAAN